MGCHAKTAKTFLNKLNRVQQFNDSRVSYQAIERIKTYFDC